MNRPHPPRAWPGNQTVGAKVFAVIAHLGELVLRNDWRLMAAGIAAAALLKVVA